MSVKISGSYCRNRKNYNTRVSDHVEYTGRIFDDCRTNKMHGSNQSYYKGQDQVTHRLKIPYYAVLGGDNCECVYRLQGKKRKACGKRQRAYADGQGT